MKKFLLPILLVIALALGGCATSGSILPSFDSGIQIDVDDSKSVYKTGRLMGVGLAMSNQTIVVEAADLATKIVMADPEYLVNVLMEQVVIFVNKKIPGIPQVGIVIAEFALALGLTDDIIVTDQFKGELNLKAIKWFAKGVSDGIAVGSGSFIPYPTDWSIFDQPAMPEVEVAPPAMPEVEVAPPAIEVR